MSTRKPPKKAAVKHQPAELVDLRFPDPAFLFAQRLDPNLVHDKARMAMYLPEAERALEQEQAKSEAGDKRAVLRAVYICAIYSMPLPDWTRNTFCAVYRGVLEAEIGSWDDAFSPAFPKGKHVEKLKGREQLKYAAYREVCDARIAGKGLGDELYSKIATKLSTNKEKVKELFYEARTEFGTWEDIDD
jgi:hypothetical protein